MKSVAAFGDSVLKGIVNTDGRYSVSKSSFARICENRLGIQLINKARMGATVTQGEKIFERSLGDVLSSSSDKVILEFGGNDCDYDWKSVSENPDVIPCPNNTIEAFRNGYTNLIFQVRNNNKEPIILSLPPIDSGRYFKWISKGLNAGNILSFLGGKEGYLGDWHEMYNLEVFKMANRLGVKIIDITSCFLGRRNYADFLCSDGIHPNEKGHELIAGEICGYFS